MIKGIGYDKTASRQPCAKRRFIFKVRSVKLGWPIALACVQALSTSSAQDTGFPKPPHLPAITEPFGRGMRVTPMAQSFYYFGWERSPDIMDRWRWTMLDMAPGSPSPTFQFQPDENMMRGYYRVRAIDKWSPGDADGDGIDDLYEMENGLDPLDRSDASQPSTANPLLTNLDVYLNRFALREPDGSAPRREYFSDEVSVLNLPGTLSPEVTVFLNDQPILTLAESISSEISVFLTDIPNLTLAEAISEEVSVFKDSAPLALASEAVSEEVSVFKDTPPLAMTSEAISAEVSVFKASPPLAFTSEAISQEVSVEFPVLQNP